MNYNNSLSTSGSSKPNHKQAEDTDLANKFAIPDKMSANILKLLPFYSLFKYIKKFKP